MEITHEQLRSIKQGTPLRFPGEESDFVVLTAEMFDRLQALLIPDDLDPEEMYPLLAEISPEDWEDVEVYGIAPKTK